MGWMTTGWRRPDSYGFAVVVALIVHLLVAGLFLLQWPESKPRMAEPVPQHMIANVVQEENKAVKQRREKAEQQRQRKALAEKRRAQQQRQQQLAAKRKKEQQRREKLKQQQLAKQKAAAEKKRKAEAERLKQQQLAEQQAAEQKAQQQRQEQQRQEQQRLEQQMLRQLAQEQAAAELEAQRQAEIKAERAAATTLEHTALIRDRITSAWRYPPAVAAEMEVTVRLTLVPTGEVIQVQIINSSGHQGLDRSVEQAIHKASPLPVPNDIAVFEQNFRHLTMKFRPENASW
ncbi:cell envelope integrity protein TolA [Bacterioplanoides pacificum]|uniref:Energy transducer TonB n=1 Tax=Bacterioplanoides pacificum TaxID=1171596 RepID=A0ABV7VQL2_9GAMM